jgi:ATP-dependent Clp protease ATP-binding subunit ClpA
MLKEEETRSDDAQAKLLQAELRVQTLEATVVVVTSQQEEMKRTLAREQFWRQDFENKLQEAEKGQAEAEKSCGRAEEALDTARRVHTREKEQWKKDTTAQIEKEIAAEKVKSKTSSDQIVKEITDQYTTRKAFMLKNMEQQLRKQLEDERKEELAKVMDEKEKLKKELQDVTRKRDGLVTFLKPYQALFNSGLSEFLN